MNDQETNHIDHSSHAKSGFKPFPDRLFVITVVFNPLRFRSRNEHYKAFEKHVKDAGAILYTVECAFGDRPFEVTEATNPYHIQLRTWSELWLKERMINIGISRISNLHPEWKKVAWIDADIVFTRPDWAQETLHQLEHYHIVQMFSHAQDLSPKYGSLLKPYNAKNLSVTGHYQSFMYSHINEIPPMKRNKGCGYGSGYGQSLWAYWHPGFAWAARREALDHLGNLIDICIAGNADHHMATALVGRVDETLPNGVGERYKKIVTDWQMRAEKHIQRDVGYVDGLVLHNWHGKKIDRKYYDRWQLLIDEKYNPDDDLKLDTFMLWQLTDNNYKLRDKLRLYMRQRNEDSIDVE